MGEGIKVEHGATSSGEDNRRKEMIDLSAAIGEEKFILPKKQLARVIDARTQELLGLVSDELKKVSRNGMLPAGGVVSGGGANLPGLLPCIKDTLRLPVRLAKPLHLDCVTDAAVDPAFAVATGLVLWGIEQEISPDSKGRSSFGNFSGNTNKVMDWLKNFMP